MDNVEYRCDIAGNIDPRRDQSAGCGQPHAAFRQHRIVVQLRLEQVESDRVGIVQTLRTGQGRSCGLGVEHAGMLVPQGGRFSLPAHAIAEVIPLSRPRVTLYPLLEHGDAGGLIELVPVEAELFRPERRRRPVPMTVRLAESGAYILWDRGDTGRAVFGIERDRDPGTA